MVSFYVSDLLLPQYHVPNAPSKSGERVRTRDTRKTMRICGGYSIKGWMFSNVRVSDQLFSLFIHEIPLRKKSRLPRSERCVASSTVMRKSQ